MTDRLEVEYWTENDKVLLKRYFTIDPPDEKGNRVGMMMFVLSPEKARDVANKLLAACDKSDDAIAGAL